MFYNYQFIKRVNNYIVFVVFCFTLFTIGNAQQLPPPVGIVEKLGEYIPLDIEVFDETGHLVQLSSILNKPAIITFVYYRCPGICNPLLNEVAMVVEKMNLELGKDYQIITLSFDPSEVPEIAAEKKDNYLNSIKRQVNPNGWHFLTSDSVNIHRITDAAGFYFQRDGLEWVHPGALIVISPQGKIARYLYGIKHLPLDVKLAVMEAAEGKTGPTIAKVLSYCYTYDPEGKRYAFDVVRVSGIVVVVFVVFFVVFFVVKKPKTNKEQ